MCVYGKGGGGGGGGEVMRHGSALELSRQERGHPVFRGGVRGFESPCDIIQELCNATASTYTSS